MEPTNQTNFNNESESEVSLAEIVLSYIKHWKFFAISICVCVFFAAIYLKYTPYKYKVVSKVVIKDESKGQIGVDMTAFSDLGIVPQSGNVDNEIEILKSKTLMQEVVDTLGLDVLYSQNTGFLKSEELYTNSPIKIKVIEFKQPGGFVVEKTEDNALLLKSDKFEFSKKVFPGESVDTPFGLLLVNLNPKGNADFPVMVSIPEPDLLPKIDVVSVNSKNSSVVEFSIVTACPEKGIDMVNKLVELYNKGVIEEKNYVSNNTIRFINDRLGLISGELKDAEKDVENYKKGKNLTDVQVEAGLYLKESSEYDKKINEVDVQISILGSIKDYLHNPKNAGSIVPSNVGLTDQTVIALIKTYNELLLEKNKMTSGMKSNNPVLQEYDTRIASLKNDLLKGIVVTESSMKLSRRELSRQESSYSDKIRGLSTQEREARELYRQKEIKETLFIYLLTKREETGLSLALATPNAKVIDRASSDSKPVQPRRMIILLAAFLVGVIFPVCVLYLRDLFNYKLSNKDELLSIIKAPFLGEIPTTTKNEPLPVAELKTRISEKFRIVSANLGFVLGAEKNKIVLITSSVPGEGKSFFARNLALSLATSGKRTLLIDLDIRKSKLNGLLGLDSTKKGLAQYLANPDISVDDIIVTKGDWHANLHIIPTKVFPPNPAELLASNRLEDLFNQVKDKYDYIIVDTPPVGLVADVFRINQFVNASIYVAREGYTHKAALRDARDLYEQKKLYNFSLVLNGVEPSKRYGYGRYGNYGSYKDKSTSYFSEE